VARRGGVAVVAPQIPRQPLVAAAVRREADAPVAVVALVARPIAGTGTRPSS
jgi:hypothetical protein